MRTAPRRRSPLTSSRWNAQGNIYLVTTDDVTADAVRTLSADTDGVLQVLGRGDDWVEIAIWNPDGSRAEMSGNGTRIAARWHGGDVVTVKVGSREVRAELREDGLVEQDMGIVTASDPEEVDGIRFIAVDVGNPHAVVEDDPDELPRIGPFLERHPRFPERTNVQVARRLGDDEIEARVWERGAGETASSGTSAVAVAAAFGFRSSVVRFPGGPLEVRFEDRRAFLAGPARPV
jgi:diaminopimelate epimerase